jgi:hypothetical protein
MTQEEEKYYNNYFDLFSSEGWQQVLEELNARAEAYDIGHLKNEKDLHTVQGELSIIRMILGLEEFITLGYDNAKITFN